jgi:hypothetical protein
MNNELIKKTKEIRKHMDQEFRKSQMTMSGMQYDIHSTNQNLMKQSHDLAEISLS